MSHNITPAREFARGGARHDDPVLTIFDSRARQEVSFHFYRSGLEAMVVVNPWAAPTEGEPVSIEGEDLYALRELLNEMPESAFVRPADPVDPNLKALLDAPPMTVAVSPDGTAWRRLQAPDAWKMLANGIRISSKSVAEEGAEIVWTPGR